MARKSVVTRGVVALAGFLFLVSLVLGGLSPTKALADTPLAITSPTPGQSVGAGSLHVTGTAPASAQIGVKVDGVSAGAATATNAGQWDLLLPSVSAGSHAITAQLQTSDHYAYLANSEMGTIDVVDVEAHSYVQEIPSINSVGATYDTKNDTVYAASRTDTGCAVVAIDGLSNTVKASLPLDDSGCGPLNITLNPAQTTAYMLYNASSGDVYVATIDTTTNTVLDTHDLSGPFRSQPSGLTVNPQGTQLWVREQFGVDIFNLPDLSYVTMTTLNLSSFAQQNIVFNQDGSRAYTGDNTNGDIYVINTNDQSFTNFYVGEGISNLAFTPDFSKLYAIATYPSSSIYVIDPTNDTVVDAQTTAQPPESLAITDDGLHFVAGDDHGTGGIFFGAVAGNATVADTIFAPQGGGFYTNTGNFVSPKRVLLLGDPVSVSFTALGAPNTGLGGTVNKQTSPLPYIIAPLAVLSIALGFEKARNLPRHK